MPTQTLFSGKGKSALNPPKDKVAEINSDFDADKPATLKLIINGKVVDSVEFVLKETKELRGKLTPEAEDMENIVKRLRKEKGFRD